MPKEKREWGKPKLIILTRGKPEEGVLAGCKSSSICCGPWDVEWWCRQDTPTGCINCNLPATS
jgi:hypothetical protein